MRACAEDVGPIEWSPSLRPWFSKAEWPGKDKLEKINPHTEGDEVVICVSQSELWAGKRYSLGMCNHSASFTHIGHLNSYQSNPQAKKLI